MRVVNAVCGLMAWCLGSAIGTAAAHTSGAGEWKPGKNVDIVLQAEEWKKDLEKNAWAEEFMASAETRKHHDGENEQLARMLADLGVTTR